MTTLRSVAEKAGVSTATVSKVLSNTPYFSEKTRQKVMQAVEELGYVPNLAARALSTGQTHIIGVVFPHIYDAIFSDPFVIHLLEGVEAECSQRGYNLLLSTPRLTPSGLDENYQRLIQSNYLDGIVALDNVPSMMVLESAQEKGIPAVAIGYQDNPVYVRSDDYSGGFQIMDYVLQLGHREIGIIGVPTDLNFSIQNRLDGMQAAAQSLDFDKLPIVAGDFSVRSGEDCVQWLLSEHPTLTAIICLNDRMAMGAIQQAQLMGYQVPEMLTVVGYDNIPGAERFTPPITTIDQQAPLLGRAATRMLFERLSGQNPTSHLMPVQLIVRDSSGVCPN